VVVHETCGVCCVITRQLGSGRWWGGRRRIPGRGTGRTRPVPHAECGAVEGESPSVRMVSVRNTRQSRRAILATLVVRSLASKKRTNILRSMRRGRPCRATCVRLAWRRPLNDLTVACAEGVSGFGKLRYSMPLSLGPATLHRGSTSCGPSVYAWSEEWSYGELNPRPLPCHGSALPTEL
jgi:hypothetical protein